MESYVIDKDIRLCCKTASTFPEGVLAAHQSLHTTFEFDGKRRFFGLSRPDKGSIIYKAAVEIFDDENPEDFEAQPGLIKMGEYTSLIIKDFRKDVPAIGKAFQLLLTNPAIDPEGYCVELYIGMDDVRCMVRLKSRN